MKKILHIPNYYEPHKGGIEDVCRTIVNIVKDTNCEIEQTVLCFNDCNIDKEDIIEGIKVYRASVPISIARQSISFSYLFILRKLIKKTNPDIIHFHCPNPLASLYLLLLIPKHCKLIVHWHSDIVAQSSIYKFIKPIESRLLKRSNNIFATSPTYIEDSIPLQNHINKVSVLQNVIDESKFKKTASIESKIIQYKTSYKNKPIVLFIGRHVTYKGLYYLIDAIKQSNKEAEYLIGGTGPLTEELKKQALGLENVHFLGRVPNEDLVSLYYAADIFAFPSITKNEAFGVVLAEAMYCNTPAITFTIKGSGVNWVNIDGDTGIEVENSNSKLFAEALDTLLESKEKRKELGLNAHNRVRDLFIKTKIEKQVLGYYR